MSETHIQPAKAKAIAQQGKGVPDWNYLEGRVQGTLTFLDSESSWAAFKLFNSASRPIVKNILSTVATVASVATTPSSPSSSPLPSSLLPRQAVLYPKSSKDVLEAINFAHRHGIDLSVKSGGYNPSDWSVKGTLILDLKELKSVVVHSSQSTSSSRPSAGDVAGEKISSSSAASTSNGRGHGHGHRLTSTSLAENGEMLGEPTVQERNVGSLTMSGVSPNNTTTTDNNAPSNTSADTQMQHGHHKRKHSPSPVDSAATDSIMQPVSVNGSGSGSSEDNTTNTTTESNSSRRSGMSSFSATSSSSSGSATPPIQTILAAQAQDLANAAMDGISSVLGGSSAVSSSSSSNNNTGDNKGKRRMLDSEKSNSNAKGGSAPHYIHANAYPPFNFVNADPEQERAFHERRASSEIATAAGHFHGNRASGHSRGAIRHDNHGDADDDSPVVIPFIYDPIRKETVFPGNAPPGTIPFSDAPAYPSSSSSSGGAAFGTSRGGGGQSLASNGSRSAVARIGDMSDMSMHVASTSSAAADPATPWPTASRQRGDGTNGNTSSSFSRPAIDHRTDSNTSLNMSLSSFGAADPSDFNLVTFGSGTTAKRLDEITSTRKCITPLGEEPNELGSNIDGVECFVPWACYPVGSAIFLTGGYGFISRLYGLSMDLVTELEIVLPPTSTTTSERAMDTAGEPNLIDGELKEEGRIVKLKVGYEDDSDLTQEERKEQEELWWACRGAGTAFGIVTGITCKAYNIGQVLAGNVIFPFNPITTPSLLKHWRDCLKVAPRELYTNVTLTAGPNERGHVVVIQFSWCGKKISDGENILQTILSWDGERCLLKDVEVRPFKHQQENVSQILSSKDDTRWLVRSTLLNSLSDTSIHKTVDIFRKCPPGASWLFETAGGAIAEPQYPSCFPLSHRKAPFQVAALHQWTNPQDDELQKKSAESWVYDCLKEESCGPFPCFLSSGEGSQRIQQVYGDENFEKLRMLKKKYDPHCLLRHTHFEDALNA